MKAVQAAEVLVEILKECRELDGAALILMPPRSQVNVAYGYKIHIDSNSEIDTETRACIENILGKHGLISIESSKGIMIYRKH